MRKHTPDNIGEVTFTTENSAVLLWRTQVANYLFANDLNQCCRIQLWRDDDLDLSRLSPVFAGLPQCPLWYCFEERSQLFYVLVDIDGCQQQLGGSLDYYDKVLFLYGRDCWDKMRMIYNDFTNRPVAPNAQELLLMQRYEFLMSARSRVEQVDYFDARDVTISPRDGLTDRSSDGYTSSLLTGFRPPYPSKVLRNMAGVNDILLDLLAAIEINLQGLEV